MAGLVQDIRPEKVAIYIRWSTEDQGEGTTLAVQQEGCQHYVLSQGWHVTPSLIFVDEGHSGGSLDRPKMTELRKAVKAGLVDCVVVYKLDRLSRSVMDTVNLVLAEWDGRTYLKSAREPVDTTTPMGKQFFYMLVSYAEWERSVIRDRMHSGKLRRAKEGRNPGMGIAYGYKRGNEVGKFEIEPEKAELVRWIFRKYLEESGTFKIADELNRTGVPSPTGVRWHTTTILQMLKNPIYAGRLVYQRTVVNPRHQRDKSEPQYLKNSDPIVSEAPCQPIIDIDSWERAQALMKQRHRNSTGVRTLASEYLLTGLLRCQCGSNMTSHWAIRRGKNYFYYYCRARSDYGKSGCSSGMIQQYQLDEVVEAKLKELLQSEEACQNFLGVHNRALTEQLQEAKNKLEHVRPALQALDRQMNQISRDYRTGQLSVTAYEENRREIETERRQLREQLAEVERVERLLAEQLKEHGSFQEILDLAKRWDELDVPRRKFVLRNVVDRVVAFKTRKTHELTVDVFWKFTDPQVAAGK